MMKWKNSLAHFQPPVFPLKWMVNQFYAIIISFHNYILRDYPQWSLFPSYTHLPSSPCPGLQSTDKVSMPCIYSSRNAFVQQQTESQQKFFSNILLFFPDNSLLFPYLDRYSFYFPNVECNDTLSPFTCFFILKTD